MVYPCILAQVVLKQLYQTVPRGSFNVNGQITMSMEPCQIFTAACLAIFLLSRLFRWDAHGDIGSEEEIILDDLDILGPAFGSIWQLDD